VTALGELIPVLLVYDVALGSPIETQPWGGRIIMVPPEMIPLPQRGEIWGQRGFSRQGATMWEWVMVGDTDPVDQFVDSLTGRPGWLVPGARLVMKTLVQRLFSAGIPRATIAAQVPQMYQAVAAEVVAEQQAAAQG
jgi:hypothetical protein